MEEPGISGDFPFDTEYYRIVEVDPLFWIQMLEVLEPDERWTGALPDGRMALRLWNDMHKLLLFTKRQGVSGGIQRY